MSDNPNLDQLRPRKKNFRWRSTKQNKHFIQTKIETFKTPEQQKHPQKNPRSTLNEEKNQELNYGSKKPRQRKNATIQKSIWKLRKL